MKRRKEMAYISQDEKKQLAPAIKKVLAKYGVKGTIGINNYSSLVVRLKSGHFDFSDSYSINPYHPHFYAAVGAQKFVEELVAAMKGTKWYDNSDAMTDYFNTAYYINIELGTGGNQYEVVA